MALRPAKYRVTFVDEEHMGTRPLTSLRAIRVAHRRYPVKNVQDLTTGRLLRHNEWHENEEATEQ